MKDDAFLNELFKHHQSSGENVSCDLTETQRQQLLQAYQSVKDGQFSTEKEVNERTESWLFG